MFKCKPKLKYFNYIAALAQKKPLAAIKLTYWGHDTPKGLLKTASKICFLPPQNASSIDCSGGKNTEIKHKRSRSSETTAAAVCAFYYFPSLVCFCSFFSSLLVWGERSLIISVPSLHLLPLPRSFVVFSSSSAWSGNIVVVVVATAAAAATAAAQIVKSPAQLPWCW